MEQEGVPQGILVDDVIGNISSLYEMTRVLACMGWFLMTGSTIHACSSRYGLKNYRAIEKNVIMVDGRKIKAMGIGTMELKMSTGCSLILKDVIHVPNIRKGIISASKLNVEGYSILLASAEKWRMFRQLETVRFNAVGTIIGGLYRLDLWSDEAPEDTDTSFDKEDTDMSDVESVQDSNTI